MSSQINFPRDASRIAAIQARLATASLGEVLTDLDSLSFKCSKVFFDCGLIEMAHERIDQLNEAEIQLNHQICDLQKELGDLEIALSRLEPLDIAIRLDILRERLSEIEKPSTGGLQKRLAELGEKWQRLLFRYAFPDANELEPDAFQANSYHHIASAIETTGSAVLEESLRSLQQQCAAAEAVFRGEGLAAFRELSESVQLDVAQRLFEQCGENYLLDFEAQELEDRQLIAGAIMASLADRLMDIQL